MLTITNWTLLPMTHTNHKGYTQLMPSAHSRGELYCYSTIIFYCRKQNWNPGPANKQWYRLACKCTRHIWEPDGDQSGICQTRGVQSILVIMTHSKIYHQQLVWGLRCHKFIKSNNFFRDQTTLRVKTNANKQVIALDFVCIKRFNLKSIFWC